MEPTKTRQWSVKLGAFLPTQNVLSHEAGSVSLNVGVDYFPRVAVRPLNGDIAFGLDLYYSQHNGSTFTSIPLTAKLLWPVSPAGARYPVYAGIGTGLWFVSTRYSSGVTEPGLKAIVGIDVTDRLFVEASYDYVSGFSNRLAQPLRADGVGVSAGYRF